MVRVCVVLPVGTSCLVQHRHAALLLKALRACVRWSGIARSATGVPWLHRSCRLPSMAMVQVVLQRSSRVDRHPERADLLFGLDALVAASGDPTSGSSLEVSGGLGVGDRPMVPLLLLRGRLRLVHPASLLDQLRLLVVLP